MRCLLITIICAAAIPVGAASMGIVRFDLSGVVDKDIVYGAEGGDTAKSFGENPKSFEVFVVDGYSDGETVADGLPRDLRVESTNPKLQSYLLQPYSGNNVIELYSRDKEPFEAHRINVPDYKYYLIGMLVSAVDGDAAFTIELHYVDGSVAMEEWQADDWYAPGPRGKVRVALGDLDRFKTDLRKIDDGNHYNVYEFILEPDSRRALDYVVIGTEPYRWPQDKETWAAVFAINGWADTGR